MKSLIWGPCLGAALVCNVAAGPVLHVTTEAGEIGALPMPEGREICLRWNHSVTGGKVADCFENRAGALVLTRAYLHDFAAGLGEVPGRGQLKSAAGGGYWITGIDEVLPDNTLTLRIGTARVDHMLGDLPLSQRAPGARAHLTLLPLPPEPE